MDKLTDAFHVNGLQPTQYPVAARDVHTAPRSRAAIVISTSSCAAHTMVRRSALFVSNRFSEWRCDAPISGIHLDAFAEHGDVHNFNRRKSHPIRHRTFSSEAIGSGTSAVGVMLKTTLL